jgi:hypothetical protein
MSPAGIPDPQDEDEDDGFLLATQHKNASARLPYPPVVLSPVNISPTCACIPPGMPNYLLRLRCYATQSELMRRFPFFRRLLWIKTILQPLKFL